MDEQSEAMFLKYEAWKVKRSAVDQFMEEARDGLGDPEALMFTITEMRQAWSEFESVSASRLHCERAS